MGRGLPITRGLSVPFDSVEVPAADTISHEEIYEFDRLGYLVLRNFLTPVEVKSLLSATERLEARANSQLPANGIPLQPHKKAPWGALYHFDEELGYHTGYVGAKAGDGANGGPSVIIEDFFNADKAFDILVDHPKTMRYIRTIIQERATINNSEIRLRYPGNRSPSHQPGSQPSGPPTGKYQYQVTSGQIDCKMVRIIYFIHDVDEGGGPFCVAPGSHKSNMPAPPGLANDGNPDEDPTILGLTVSAGDAILFTESLRHGGLSITSGVARKTLHVGYGPYYLMSQNISTMDEPPFLTHQTYSRYSEAQRTLFNAWPRDKRTGASYGTTAVLSKL